MTSQWPEDDRSVEIDPEAADLADSDPDLLDAEVGAETPLDLTEDQLRGDDPSEDAAL
jgi:hypothetical protein